MLHKRKKIDILSSYADLWNCGETFPMGERISGPARIVSGCIETVHCSYMPVKSSLMASGFLGHNGHKRMQNDPYQTFGTNLAV